MSTKHGDVRYTSPVRYQRVRWNKSVPPGTLPVRCVMRSLFRQGLRRQYHRHILPLHRTDTDEAPICSPESPGRAVCVLAMRCVTPHRAAGPHWYSIYASSCCLFQGTHISDAATHAPAAVREEAQRQPQDGMMLQAGPQTGHGGRSPSYAVQAP